MKGMSIYIYAKKTEDIHTLDNVIDIIRKNSDEIIVSVENKRCFRELAAMKEKSIKEDIIVVQNLIQRSNNIVEMPRNKRSNSGRNKIDFPNNSDELFEKWKSKEISSIEFISSTGLKKATFYNLLTEYKEIQRMNDEYTERYKSV